jgi:predicted short-subunit dehydrogenase-like oxidoreductase (DUF2520 family)
MENGTGMHSCLAFTAKVAGWRRGKRRHPRAHEIPASERTSQKLGELLTQGVADGDARAELLKLAVRKIVEEALEAEVAEAPVPRPANPAGKIGRHGSGARRAEKLGPDGQP